MKGNFFIGIDAGTTSVKGVLADDQGNILSASSQEYTLEMKGDRCELDADVYWQKTKSVISDIIRNSGVKREDIHALSFSSQGETLICMDSAGVPLRKAIVWLDNRSVKEARCIEKYFGRELICRKTGQPHVQALWPATRILWLREHEPALFQQVSKFLLVEDYLLFRCTGKYITEQTLVSSTLYYDIREKKWWMEMLEYLRITETKLPEVCPSGTVIGSLSETISSELGLSVRTQIVTGAYDHVAGALGAGNHSEGIITETTGSSMAMVVTLDRPIDNLSINIPQQCHALEGKYLLLPYGQTAGMVLKWFKEQFCREEENIAKGEPDGNVYKLLDARAEKIPPGSEGLIMLPHLSGSGSPEFDMAAKGVFAGITANMSKAHFLRAILESIACMVTRNVRMLQDAGIDVQEIRALGGGAKSNLWNQIKADVANVKIVTVQGQETAALGAAILAAAGSGFFSSIQGAAGRMVKLNRTFDPNTSTHNIYKQVFDRYVQLTESLKNFWQL